MIEFPCIPCLHFRIHFPLLLVTWVSVAHLLQLMSQSWYIITN